MAKEYVPVFFDWLQVTEELNDQEKGRLIDAMVLYAMGGDWQERIKGNERYLFPAFREQINRNNELSDVRARARKNKPEQTITNDNKTEQKLSNENTPEQTESKSPKEKEKEKEKEKDKEKEREKLAHEAEIADRFSRFWAAYPRKEAKKNAEAAFRKIDPDEDLLVRMLDSIAKWARSEQWTKDGQAFIPHPATWLNGRRWEDEPPRAASGKVTVGQFQQRDYSGAEPSLTELLDNIEASIAGGQT